MGNLALVLNLLIPLLAQADNIGKLISLAQSQGRDITDAELDALVAADATARKALQDAIDAANAAKPPVP